MTDTTSTTPQASEKARHLVYVIEAVAREIIEGKAPATAGGKARAALLTYIAELEAENAAQKTHITEENQGVKNIVLRVIAFAGQLEAWGHQAAASEILTEILGGQVNAPDYYALEAENAHLMHASEEVMAENVRLAGRVARLEEIIHAARTALDEVIVAPPRGSIVERGPATTPKIDPDLGW